MILTPEEFAAQIFAQGELPFLRPLLALAEIRAVKKNEILIREGEIPEEIFFIVDGIYRGFFENSNARTLRIVSAAVPENPLSAVFRWAVRP